MTTLKDALDLTEHTFDDKVAYSTREIWSKLSQVPEFQYSGKTYENYSGWYARFSLKAKIDDESYVKKSLLPKVKGERGRQKVDNFVLASFLETYYTAQSTQIPDGVFDEIVTTEQQNAA